MPWYYILLIVIASLLLLNILLAIFLMLPGNIKKCNDVSFLYKNVIAHRGFYNNDLGIMENSKEAFNLAIEKNYNIETDLSLTKDHIIIMYHDSDFKRLFNLDKKVSELTYDEIQKLKYKNSDAKIMTFEEFLTLVDGKVGLLLEFKFDYSKNDKILCVKAAKLLEKYKGNFAVQSFNPFMVKFFKDNYPKYPRGQLYMQLKLKKMKGFKGFIKNLTSICYNLKLTNIVSRPLFINEGVEYYGFLDKLCHLFMKVIVWTVKTDKQYDYFYKRVDNIIIENLDLNEDGTRKK